MFSLYVLYKLLLSGYLRSVTSYLLLRNLLRFIVSVLQSLSLRGKLVSNWLIEVFKVFLQLILRRKGSINVINLFYILISW